MLHHRSILRMTSATSLLALALLLFAVPIAGWAASSNISYSYEAGPGIVSGGLVSLDREEGSGVVLSNTDNGSRLVGVAVGNTESLVSIDAADAKIQVAITGAVPALVSTVNGPIAIGDEIGVSPFSGIGMKAAPNSRIIGLAQETVDDSSSDLVDRTVTDKAGASQTVQVKLVQIAIAIGPAAASSDEDEPTNILSKLAKSLTGRDVSTPRVIISTIVAVVAIIALVVLLYSTVYATIIAIGRNPLAKRAVFRSLILVMTMAVFTGLVAIGSIFLILR